MAVGVGLPVGRWPACCPAWCWRAHPWTVARPWPCWVYTFATRSNVRPVGVPWLAGLPVGRVPIWWPVAVLCLVLACLPRGRWAVLWAGCLPGGRAPAPEPVAVPGEVAARADVAMLWPTTRSTWPPVLGAYVCHQIEHPARGRCCGLGADLVAGGPGHSQGIPTRSNTRPGVALPGAGVPTRGRWLAWGVSGAPVPPDRTPGPWGCWVPGAGARGRAVAGAQVIHPPPTPFNCQKLS